MNSNFWLNLKKPILVLAPMAEVTDAAFRRVIAQYGKPHVLWTEFVSADGLCHPVARERLLKDLIFSEMEKPIVAQIFSSQPEKVRQASALIRELGFDGVDLNMGCPDRSIEKQGSGATLIKNPQLAKELIRAAREGAGDKIPVSVKTRLGYNQDELEAWLPELLAAKPALITIHARTRKEMSKVPARWDRVKRAVEIRDERGSETLIFGNGDVASPAQARELAVESGADGVMLGRAIFGNPWLFAEMERLSLAERLRVLLEHAKLFEELLGEIKSFAVMKKHFKSYLSGLDDSKTLRLKLMEANNVSEVEKVIKDYLFLNLN